MRFKLFLLLAPAVSVALALLAAAGCLGDGDTQPHRQTPVFSHKLHVVEQEMKCGVCHKQADKGDIAGMPTAKSCLKCHQGIDEKKTPERRIQAFVKDDKPMWSHVTAISKDVKFSHKTHIDAKLECTTCHQGIENSKEVSARLRVSMKACVDCHSNTGVGRVADNGCLVCHTYIDKHWKPPSHQNDWKQLHGREAGFAAKGSAVSCDTCHTTESCTQCHRDEIPKNHTNYWRLRGHAVSVDMDRTQCKVCHTEDFCIRCHSTVTPASHRGRFDSLHCLECHQPLKENNCFVCHKNDRSHLAAPKLPTNKVHVTATKEDCRTCHFGLKLGHLDNGDDCLSCHKR